jgi:hypothetical protein
MIHQVKQKPHRTETRIIQITRPTKQIQNRRWNIAVPTNRSTLRKNSIIRRRTKQTAKIQRTFRCVEKFF